MIGLTLFVGVVIANYMENKVKQRFISTVKHFVVDDMA